MSFPAGSREGDELKKSLGFRGAREARRERRAEKSQVRVYAADGERWLGEMEC